MDFLRRFVFLFLFLSFAGIACATPAWAQKDHDHEDLDKRLIRKNIQLSNKVDSYAKDLDVFLTGDDISKKPNKSTVTIVNRVTSLESEKLNYEPHLDVRLHLPNLEKKWQLRFTTYDEDREDHGINASRLRTEQRREEYGASLAFFRRLGNVDTTFRPRIEIGKVSHILTFESSAEHNGFRFNPRLELFARSDSGTGEFLGLNLDYLLNNDNLLTLITEEQYTDGDNLFTTNNGVRWAHSYNARMTQKTSLIFQSVSQPLSFHLDRYTLASSFQHKLYKNVMHYSATPYFQFLRERDFQRQLGFTLEVSLIF